MSLTTAQQATVKSDILASPDLNSQPHTPDGAFAIAFAYALVVSPDFFVYRTAIPSGDIHAQITWANLTPADAVPTDTQLNVETWQARSLACQGKQFNLQMLLQALTLDATRSNVRSGLQDALTNIPAGAGGAPVSAGWVNVRDNVLARKANRLEKLLATGSGATAATAATMGFEGTVSYQDIVNLMGW